MTSVSYYVDVMRGRRTRQVPFQLTNLAFFCIRLLLLLSAP